MKWIETKIGEFCPFTYGKAIKKSEQVEVGIPVYGSNGIYTYSEKALAGPYVVIIGRKGTVGKVNLSEQPCWVSDTAFYIEFDSLDEAYFAYYILSILGLENMNTDAAVPGLNRDNAHRLEIKVPESASLRRELVRPLIGVDQKIRVNERINQTLEQIAQAIFKSWFVDFEPVKAKINALAVGGSEEDALLATMQAISGKDKAQLTQLQTENPEHYNQLRTTAELFPSAMQDSELGEIPEGWQIGMLQELLDFNPKRSLKKGQSAHYLDMKNVPTQGHIAEEIVMREFGSGTKFMNGDTLLARITPCLENGKTAFVDFLMNDEIGWGSTEFIVLRPIDQYPVSLGYFIARDDKFRQYAMQSMTGTSGRQRANHNALAELPWLLYPLDLVEAFDKVTSVYMSLARSGHNQSKSLAEIRDTLLPKLLCGQLNLEEIPQ